MVTVFRIEAHDGYGPYQDRKGVTIITDVCKDFDRHQRLPTSFEDGLPTWIGVSAFPSVEALKKWFTMEEIWLMMGLGYKIKEIKALCMQVGKSGLQCKILVEDVISSKVVDPNDIL